VVVYAKSARSVLHGDLLTVTAWAQQGEPLHLSHVLELSERLLSGEIH